MATPTAERLPSPDEIRNQLLNDLLFRHDRAGLKVNVKRGSPAYFRAEALANRVSLAYNNGQARLRAVDPNEAVGDDLEALAGFYGVFRRPASKASGFVTIALEPGSTSVSIPVGHVIVSPLGVEYQTTLAYATAGAGDTLQVEAINGGDTDVAAGTVMTWASASVAGLKPFATVGTAGLDGGREADDDETLRTRLKRALANPAGGGNWAQTAQAAEDASAAVAQAFIYSTLRGAGSVDVAVLGPPTDLVLGVSTQVAVASAVAGIFPGIPTDEAVNVTAIALEALDIVVDLDLPLPQIAGGSTGGWTDTLPWPSDAETAGVFAEVTAVGAGTITVDSTSADPPVAGNRFAVWDASEETMLEFSVVSVAGSSGAYVITVDTQQTTLLGNVAVGARCSALADNLQLYADTFVAQVKALGPGEKTADSDLLRYARRQPRPENDAPFALTSRALSAITNAYVEVSDASYAQRVETGTTTTRTEPSVPSTTADPPKKLSVENLSFRAKR